MMGQGTCSLHLFRSLRDLTAETQHWGVVLDCRGKEMGIRLLGGASRFFLVQLRGHSFHFFISHLPGLYE